MVMPLRCWYHAAILPLWHTLRCRHAAHAGTGKADRGGRYRGRVFLVEEALDAAVAAVETAATPTREELEALLIDGIGSGEAVEADEAFWNRLRAETGQMVTERQGRKQRR